MIPAIIKIFATSCVVDKSANSFLSFPTWYEYLPGTIDPTTNKCSPGIVGINDLWLIVAAVIDILLRLAAIIAVIFIIYGGVQYITSQGSPDKTDQARSTVISAVVGLTIAVVASVVVGFLARKLG